VPGARLDSIALSAVEDGPSPCPCIRIDYTAAAYPVPRSETVTVPVPTPLLEKARLAVEAVKNANRL
jgi:hypothetical protein